MVTSINSINENLTAEKYPQVEVIFGRHNGGMYSYENGWNPEVTNMIRERAPKILTVDGLQSTSVESGFDHAGLPPQELATLGTHVIFGDTYALPTSYPPDLQIQAMVEQTNSMRNYDRGSSLCKAAIIGGLILAGSAPKMSRRSFLKYASFSAAGLIALPTIANWIDGNNFSSKSDAHNFLLQMDDIENNIFEKNHWFNKGRHAMLYLKTQDYIGKTQKSPNDAVIVMGYKHAPDHYSIEHSREHAVDMVRNFIKGSTMMARKYMEYDDDFAKYVRESEVDIEQEIRQDVKTYQACMIRENNSKLEIVKGRMHKCDILEDI